MLKSGKVTALGHDGRQQCLFYDCCEKTSTKQQCEGKQLIPKDAEVDLFLDSKSTENKENNIHFHFICKLSSISRNTISYAIKQCSSDINFSAGDEY